MSFSFASTLQGSFAPSLDCFHLIYIIQMMVKYQEAETLFSYYLQAAKSACDPQKEFSEDKHCIHTPSSHSWK